MTEVRVVMAGEVGYFKGGSGFPLRFQGRKSGEFPFFKVSDMNNPGNEQFMRTANNYISETVRKRMGAVRIPAGAIVFAKVGAAVFLERKRILAQDSCIDNNMSAFIVDPAEVDVRFAHYLLSDFKLGDLAATTALPSLNGGQLRSVPLRLPGLAEQREVVDALRSADDLTRSIELIIAKKRAIKQGMMQELLTGRTRLPGFADEWQAPASLTDLCTRHSGYWGLSQQTSAARNPVRVITAGDISPRGRITGAAERFFTDAQLSTARCSAGDLVITSSGNGLGKTAYVGEAGRLAASNFVRILRPLRGVFGEFLAQVMWTPAARVMLDSNTATSAYPNLMPSFFTERWIPFPSFEEQGAIAAALRDADEEIAALERRLKAVRAIKQGMMQELLTGRTRLVPTETSV